MAGIAALAGSTAALAQQAPTTSLNQIRRVESSAGLVRIVCSQKPNFTTLTLSAPPRLVVDFADTVLAEGPHQTEIHQGALASVRTEGFRSDTGSVARVVVAIDGEADTDIEVGPDNTLQVHVTAVRSAPSVANRAPSSPKVEVVSEADVRARADAQTRAATEGKVRAEEQARQANEAKSKSEGLAESEHRARADAEARAQQESEGRAAAEAKAQAAEARLAQLEAANRTAEQGRAVAEAKAQQESEARAAAEAHAEKEQKAAEQEHLAAAHAKESEEARAREAKAAQSKAVEEQRLADAAQAKQRTAEESARQANDAAHRAEDAKQKQIAEATLQARLAEEAHQKQLAADEARRAERDRIAQLEKQHQDDLEKQHRDDQARERRDADARARADTEAKAEQRQMAQQKAADRRGSERREDEAAHSEETAPPVRVASAREVEPVVVRGAMKDISLVGFRQTAGGSRVFVRANDAVKYSVTSGGTNRIVLEVENARISQRNGTRPLDTSFFDGPVTLIAPSEDRRAHTVRVEIDLREMVPYETRLEGNDVVIDFQG